MLASERRYRRRAQKELYANGPRANTAVLTLGQVAKIMTERGMPMSTQRVYSLECSAMAKMRTALEKYR